MVTQYAANDIGMEHVKFGIYEDPALQKPIDYPEYKPYLRMVLEPGTYYMAVYTTKKSDDFLLHYTSWYCTIENDIQLQPGEMAYFLGDANEETYFQVDVDDAGEIIVDPNGFAGKLSLCSEDKEVISEEVTVPEEMKKKQDVAFYVEQPGIYYLRLRDFPEDYFNMLDIETKIKLNSIKYVLKEE